VGVEQPHLEALDPALLLEPPVVLDRLAEDAEALLLAPVDGGAPADEQAVIGHGLLLFLIGEQATLTRRLLWPLGEPASQVLQGGALGREGRIGEARE
jgi:hypothetical protein